MSIDTINVTNHEVLIQLLWVLVESLANIATTPGYVKYIWICNLFFTFKDFNITFVFHKVRLWDERWTFFKNYNIWNKFVCKFVHTMKKEWSCYEWPLIEKMVNMDKGYLLSKYFPTSSCLDSREVIQCSISHTKTIFIWLPSWFNPCKDVLIVIWAVMVKYVSLH